MSGDISNKAVRRRIERIIALCLNYKKNPNSTYKSCDNSSRWKLHAIGPGEYSFKNKLE